MKDESKDKLIQAIELKEEGTYLLQEAGQLYRAASKAQTLPEILKLMQLALDKDIEALSQIWEATMIQKNAIDSLSQNLEDQVEKIQVFDYIFNGIN